jgi:preprotein translocase subunit SecF
MLSLPEKIRFMKIGRYAFVLSIVLTVASLLSIAFKGFNLGLDFTGGTVVEVAFDQAVDLENLRESFSEQSIDAQVQLMGNANAVMMRFPPAQVRKVNQEPLQETTASSQSTHQNAENAADKKIASTQMSSEQVLALLTSAFPGHKATIKKVDIVGPQVGDELRDKSGIAMIVALACMCIYVAFRFQYKFSLGALVALVHDTILTLGFFSFFQLPFDLNVLAAVLGVIGYSLNDTIVVFDRVRENFSLLREETTENIIDISITQTLGRTLMTSICTLLVLLAMLILGGDALFGFSLALTIGIVVGTYSSYYIASYILILTRLSKDDFFKVVDDSEPFEENFE